MRRMPHYKSYDRAPLEFKSRRHKEEGDIMTLARKHVVTITPTMPVKEAAGVMAAKGIRRLPVVRAGTKKPMGMLRSRDVVDFIGGGELHKIVENKYRGNFYSAVKEPVSTIMSKDYPTGDVYMSIKDAAKELLKTGAGGMPILNEEGGIAGIVSERDFITYMPASTGSTVDYYMSRHVVTAGQELPIHDVIRRMVSWGVRRIPVVSGRDLVGIVTTVDVIKYFGTNKVFEHMRSHSLEDVLKIPVKEIMSREVVKVTPEMDIGEAAALMREKRCGGLPVVSGGSMVGIVTERDLLRLLV